MKKYLVFFLIENILFCFTLTAAPSIKASKEGFQPPIVVPIPNDNPVTQEKVELGKQLFFDTRLSKNGTISCASCHNVMSGGEDNRAGSVGINGQVGARSAPTVWNAALQSVMFWDGRAKNLEEQACSVNTHIPVL